MIPTWKNITSAAPQLSQRALETSGDQMQQAFAGLQDMAAQQRGFNIKAEEAATAENLLKFQQAARNMSLGELDALGKAAPDQLMQQYGLNQRNVGQALDFANNQDDVVRKETIERDQYNETLRAQAERPLIDTAKSLLAKSLATGDSSEFDAYMASGPGVAIADKSDLIKEDFLNERNQLKFEQDQAKYKLDLELAKENRAYTQEQRANLANERTANIALGNQFAAFNEKALQGQVSAEDFAALDKASSNPAILAKNPAAALETKLQSLSIYANGKSALTPEAKTQVDSVLAQTKKAQEQLEQQTSVELTEFKNKHPINTYDNSRNEYANTGSYGAAADKWITNNTDRLTDNLLFDGGNQSKATISAVVDKINAERSNNNLPPLPVFLVGAALDSMSVDYDLVNEIDSKSFETALRREQTNLQREDENRAIVLAKEQELNERKNAVLADLTSNANDVQKAAIKNQQLFFSGKPPIDFAFADPLKIVQRSSTTFTERKLAEDRTRIREEEKNTNSPQTNSKQTPMTTREYFAGKPTKVTEQLTENLSKNPFFRSNVGTNKPLPNPPNGMTIKDADRIFKLAEELQKNKTLEEATPQQIGMWLKSDGKGNVGFGSRTQNSVTVGPRWQEFQANGTKEEKQYLLEVLKGFQK